MSNARKGMAAVFAATLLAVGCGGGGSSMPPTSGTPTGGTTGGSSSSPLVITIANMSFSPNAMAVKAGETVVWKNNDTMAHTATQDQGAFDTGSIPPGGTSKPILISDTSKLTYHCSVHPGMIGVLNGTVDTPGY